MINLNNWNYCFYTINDQKSFISMAASPPVNNDEVNIFYTITISNIEGKDIYQSEYPTLDAAVTQINNKYTHWDFNDPLISDSSSGCSSCDNA